MKKYIFVFLVLFLSASLFSCAFSPKNQTDTIVSAPAPLPPEKTEEKEEEIPAFKITFDEAFLFFTDDPETPTVLAEFLENAEKERMTMQGNDVVAVKIENEIKAEEVFCKKEEIRTFETIEPEILPDITPTFYVILRKTETVYEKPGTVYKSSSAYTEGVKVTESAGVTGEIRSTYLLTYSGGNEISKELESETTVTEKKDEVVLVGTKKSTASTGKYGFPLDYMYITSGYGNRTLNGKSDFHLGLDLRAATGTQVYASDGGKVIFAGYNSSYGYLVKIEHDNGDLTYYAHLSKITVSVGERVYKGQSIAKSGATGNVTGPHLHFEIRKNGKTVDPRLYLPKF